VINATASLEVRKLLSSNFDKVSDLYKRLAGPEGDDRRRSERIKQELCSAEFDRIESPSLRLEKFVHLGGDTKRFEMEAVIACSKKITVKFSPLSSRLPSPGRKLTMKLMGRLIVNQAGGVLENAGLCLHRYFGCPYIPGSTIKGIARHAAWSEWVESRERNFAEKIVVVFGFPTGDAWKKGGREADPEDCLDDFIKSSHPNLFGENGLFSAFSGTVSFLSAFPVGRKAILVTDILNCHHMKYYNGDADYLRQSEGRAVDNESPNPQFFPAVEIGADFEFSIMPSRGLSDKVMEKIGLGEFDPMSFAEKYLQIGLEVYGIGAKTAAGYGWFKRDKEMEDVVAEQRKKEEVEAMAKKEEEDRMASLSPEERQALEYWKTITGDHDSYIISKFKEIKNLPEEERNNLLILCRTEARRIWLAQFKQFRAAEKEISVLEKQVAGLTGKKAAKQLKKLNRKKENVGKDLDKFRSRVEPVLEQAEADGIALPEVGS